MKREFLKSAAVSKTFVCLLAVLFCTGAAYAAEGPKNDKAPKAEKSAAKAKVNLADVKLENIHFGFDQRAPKPDEIAELDRVAKLLIENKGSLKISGHADNIGTYLYNWKLSASRSQSVKDYLVSKGADESKIAATEFGDTKPIASNKTKSGRQKNRRVEMAFL